MIINFKDKSIKIMFVILLLFGILLGAYEEFWKQGAKKVVNQNITMNQSNEVYVEVIWDASGSMWGREVGVEKIIKSKEVLKYVSNQIPENINIGLRIFGARRVGDLKDSFLALPFSDNNNKEMLNFITNVKPLGKSPIAYSLEEANKDLSKMPGNKYVLLVTDGIDNGEIPADKVLSELKNNDIILHIIHIGNINDQQLKNKLKEMSEKTGGRYFTYYEEDEVIATFSQK